MEERFDLNQTQVSGAVQRIWDYGEDIFVRLQFTPDEDRPSRYITVRIPQGMINGEFVTIQPGELIQVEGYLVDAPYTETIRQFFNDAKAKPFFQDSDDAQAWESIEIARVGTHVCATALGTVTSDPCLNRVLVQGVVSRTWNGGADTFARIAIYDRYTEIIKEGKNGKLPKRKPHYITVRFPNGEAGGKKIVLKQRNRLRVAGRLHIHFYRQTLEDILKRSGNEALIESAGPKAQAIYAVRNSLYVVADSAVVLASKKTVAKSKA